MPVKGFLLFLFSSLQVCVVSGQEYYNAPPPQESVYQRIDLYKVRLGVFIAPDVSWMHPTASKSDDGNYYVSSTGAKAGYSWGLMAEYFFAQNYGVVSGIELNTGGGKIEANFNPNQVNSGSISTVLKSDFNYNLQYIQVPFALKLRSDKISDQGLRIFGQLGLTLAINISKKASYTVAYNDDGGTAQTLQGDNEKLTGFLAASPIIIQLNIGGGLEYPITPKLNLYGGLFFNNGFLPNTVSPQNYKLGYSGSFTDGYTRLNNVALKSGAVFF